MVDPGRNSRRSRISICALRAVLQPHPVLRRADRRRVEPTTPRMRRLSPPAGCGGCSVRGCAASGADAFGCDTVALVLFPEAAAPASASPASRFALAVVGIDHGRCLEANARSPNGPIRARMKLPDSPGPLTGPGSVQRRAQSVLEKRPGPPLCAACEEKSVTGYCRQTRERNDIEWARATGTAPPCAHRGPYILLLRAGIVPRA